MELQNLEDQLSEISIEEQLKKISSIFAGKVVFTTSFGIEDQVITDIVFRNDLKIEVATIDTGRQFPETYKVFSETFRKYNKTINVYFPESAGVEKMMSEKGPYSFYLSKENRLECCRIRKVGPLNRILEKKECWISGIRASQSDGRSQMHNIEYDEARKLLKFYPLFDWTFEDVKKYVKENNVPYNVLHDKGFVSIGCEPCTRAVNPGDDFRAGRWWWEEDGKKECGLHTK
jgi:phosphoadenosine phosphosulfate reductase